MTLEQLLELAEERGRKQGIEEARNRMMRLIKILLESDRLDDLDRAMKDDDYMETLFKEFGLK